MKTFKGQLLSIVAVIAAISCNVQASEVHVYSNPAYGDYMIPASNGMKQGEYLQKRTRTEEFRRPVTEEFRRPVTEEFREEQPVTEEFRSPAPSVTEFRYGRPATTTFR